MTPNLLIPRGLCDPSTPWDSSRRWTLVPLLDGLGGYWPVSTQESNTRTDAQFALISAMNCVCRGCSW